MTLKLTARWVLGFDGADHLLFEDGEVVVDGGRVLHVGHRSSAPADRHEDFGQALLAPGFVDLNALADVDTTILGFGGKIAPGAKAWSSEYAARPRDVLTPDQMLTAARGAFCQLMLSGITTALPVTSLLFRQWAESGAEFDAIAGLAGELGLRLFLGPSFRSHVNVMERDGRIGQVADEMSGLAGLAEAVAFIERNRGAHGGLVSGLLVPSTIETCSDELLLRTAEAAQSLDVPFRLHCCQSLTEADLIWKRSGKSSIAHLRDLGVLSERALLPHAIDLGGPRADPALSEADRAALAGSGATVVHCPLVVGRGGRRLDNFARFRDEGIRIAMGTDTAPPNMLMNLQIGLAMARMDEPEATRPADYFRAATLGGAQALGRPDLGRLEEGAAADIVAWDLSALDIQPVHDPVEALFLMPPGLRARHVWIAGRRVVSDGKIAGVDEARFAADMQAIFEQLRESYEERHQEGHSWPTLFPSAFPVRRKNETSKHWEGEHS
ncbi:chlorohydrolase family protein [Mesorhizobium sp. KR1-2]|uniref:chlorohydrolase family protein n=1 Tax=Mesorhizobium sp. KR1-2 TaxID=3156609 RepID=UPI0032B5A42A